jgi:hypothetical protein
VIKISLIALIFNEVGPSLVKSFIIWIIAFVLALEMEIAIGR